ncbi:Kelch-like protein 10 [Orchesella cincta]|uniref:Kelch-like protein 10 n=1 Tax=Orchesella cincta TaxID=48709 RepID=A0A1D2NDK7_ORCCI|nr:Kelch-like protein 10 [Orchesella cincta]
MSDETNNNNDNTNNGRLVTNKVKSKNGTVRVSASAVEAADDDDSFIEDARNTRRNVSHEVRYCPDGECGCGLAYPRPENIHRSYEFYSDADVVNNNDAILRSSDGFYFPVHRVILCGESDYFKTLFTTTLHTEERTDIVVYNIRGEMLGLLLDFIYTREMWLNDENVLPILEAADFLSLIKIKNKCCEYIENQVEELNCLGIRRFAKNWYCPDLERVAHQFLMRQFVEVSKTSDELLDLSLDEVISLFSDDELNVKNEEVVWEAALRWISHDADNRKAHIVDLLKTVRTGLMETQYFMEKVKECNFVQGHEGCRPIVIETLRFLYDLEVITERDGEIPTPSIARPRIPHEILFAIGGWSGGSPTNYIETYDTRADRWIRVNEVDPTGPRAYHGTVAIGFKIYVVGGFDGVDYFDSCRVFDAVTKKWKFIASMYNRRCYVSVALLDNDKIYAMGGYDGQHRQNSCERFDTGLNQWTQICPMNCQRSDASATSLRNVVYICGGFNGVECLNSCECYDPEINQWTMILPMRSRRSGVSCIAYNDNVYVVGGFNGISRMCSGEKFNPDTNTWTSIPDMYNPRSNFAIEVIDDLLFCIGGFTGTSTTFNVECYDQKTNEWYEATDMNIYRSALAACVIPGLPNIQDFIHPHRDRLMEEKRQRLLVLQQQQGTPIPFPQNSTNTNAQPTQGNLIVIGNQEQLQNVAANRQ